MNLPWEVQVIYGTQKIVQILDEMHDHHYRMNLHILIRALTVNSCKKYAL